MAYTTYGERWDTQDVFTATAGEAIAFARACVKFESEGVVIKTVADTDVAVGLSADIYADEEQCEYLQRGRLDFIAGGTIAVGDQLCPDDGTAGRIRTAIAGDLVVGTATVAASVGEKCTGDFDFVAATVL